MSVELAAYDALLARCPTLAPVRPTIDAKRCPECRSDKTYSIVGFGPAGTDVLDVIRRCIECNTHYRADYACVRLKVLP